MINTQKFIKMCQFWCKSLKYTDFCPSNVVNMITTRNKKNLTLKIKNEIKISKLRLISKVSFLKNVKKVSKKAKTKLLN